MAKKKNLKSIDASSMGAFRSKEEGLLALETLKKKLYELLYKMFAHNKHSLLIILHGIDASGKDGAVRHLFECANPQGITVHSFKQPSEEELRHDFLWRCHRVAPEAGRSAIFNRSYYEEVSTVVVHPEMLDRQHIPQELMRRSDFFERRFKRINEFEKMLTQQGTAVLKFFLHISKSEQKERLENRLIDSSKNWKFSEGDLAERKLWDDYMKAFDRMIKATSTPHAPWHVIPADHKWYRNYLVTKKIVDHLTKLKMSYPKVR